MDIEKVISKSAGVLLIFISLALFFTIFRQPIAEVNNWLLMFCHEGRVTKGAGSSDISAPPMKIEQFKGASSGSSSNSGGGSTFMEKAYDIPVFDIVPVESGKVAKGDIYISAWAMLGPVMIPNPAERKDDYCMMDSIDLQLVDDEQALDGTQSMSFAKWHSVYTTNPNGRFDLRLPYPNTDFAIIYAVAKINVPEDMPGTVIKIGSDDYAKIWVNGEMVLKYNTKCRGCAPDSDTSDSFTLKKGLNTIVFKCVQISGGWELCARLADAEGNRILLQRQKKE